MAAFEPGGSTMVAAILESLLRFLVADGTPLGGFTSDGQLRAISADATMLVAGNIGDLTLLDGNGLPLRPLTGPDGGYGISLESTVFSPDGALVALTNSEGHLVVSKTSDGLVFLEKRSFSGMGLASWSQDGKVLATGGRDGIVKLWQMSP